MIEHKNNQNKSKFTKGDMVRLIKLTISLSFWAVWWCWTWFYRIVGKKPPGICVVLYYHSVTPEQRSKFAQQMDDVMRLAKPIAADIKDRLEDGIHYVAITFDDGYQSFIENALPELIQRKIPSTMFMPTGYLGQRPGWINEQKNPYRCEHIMTVSQLGELPSDLVSIGSHTVTHRDLSLLDDEEIKYELLRSRQKLESILGRTIKLLSFPYGSFDQRVIELCRHAGYERVFTILPVLAFSMPKEYVTGRVSVELTDRRLEFRLKILGAYRWLPFAFAIKHKLASIFKNHYGTHSGLD